VTEQAPHFIGIDIGGTNTRIGSFRSLDVPAFTPLARFPTQQDYSTQKKEIFAALQKSAPLAGIGISFAGRIALDGRSVINAPNLPGYVNQPLVDELEAHFRCPVRLAHDPVCGLLAEKQFGTLQNNDRSAYLTLSTGTGAAFQLCKDGTTMTISIEIGHQLLDGNTLPCLCGQIGCLETFTGGRQIESRTGVSLAQTHDPAFWETFCDKLSLGLVNLALLTKVDAVAISGAIALNHSFLLPRLQQLLEKRLTWSYLTLHRATFGEDAPLIGAALLLTTPENSILH
jgi:predicted NBD/HSP70 family sugar kinase